MARKIDEEAAWVSEMIEEAASFGVALTEEDFNVYIAYSDGPVLRAIDKVEKYIIGLQNALGTRESGRA